MTKKRKELLNEDFLSDMEQKPVSAEDVAGAPENVADDDFADLLGGKTAQAEPQVSQSAQEDFAETVSTLKDAVNGLAVSVKEIKDAIAKQAEPAPAAEPAVPAAPEAAPDAPPNVDLDTAPDGSAESAQSEPAPESEQAPEDKPIEDKPAEGGEGSQDSGSEDDFSQDESRPEDATKSEAYQMNRKAGKLLNSNSGSIIGIVESGKLYKLDEMIMTAVKAKIREKINEAKANLKAEFLREAAELPKSEPEVINEEEQKVEEAKSESKKPMSFLEKLKAAKACKGSECSEDKCDESKKSSDKSSSECEEDEDGKKKEH
jgi:hypothetical protein